MSSNRILGVAVTGWAIAALASLTARILLVNAPVSITESAAWIFVGCAPGAIALALFRRGSSPTIAQVLYETEHAGTVNSGKPANGTDGARP